MSGVQIRNMYSVARLCPLRRLVHRVVFCSEMPFRKRVLSHRVQAQSWVIGAKMHRDLSVIQYGFSAVNSKVGWSLSVICFVLRGELREFGSKCVPWSAVRAQTSKAITQLSDTVDLVTRCLIVSTWPDWRWSPTPGHHRHACSVAAGKLENHASRPKWCPRIAPRRALTIPVGHLLCDIELSAWITCSLLGSAPPCCRCWLEEGAPAGMEKANISREDGGDPRRLT